MADRPASPEYLLVGRVLRPHGVRGALLLNILTEFPERLMEQDCLYLGPRRRRYEVASAQRHGRELLLSLVGISDRDAAEDLRGMETFIRAADAGAPTPGRYFYHQVEGLEVFSDQGELLGRVAQILETGANDVYVVRNETGGEILLPAISSVVREYDLERGRLIIHLLEGLR